jgi:ABC-2 type transport system permease protein
MEVYMFRHIYVYRIKCLLRNRPMVFWTFIYPIVMALLFYVAFANLTSADLFKSIPMSVVDNAEFKGQSSFASVISEYSSSADALFKVSYDTQEQAESKLESGSIKGYIIFDNGAHVVFKDSGIEQSIIKEFMDSYLQTAAAYSAIIGKNPDAAKNLSGAGDDDFIENITYGSKEAPDTTVAYFYALMAMAALFGSFWGQKEVEDIQADMTTYGARMNMTPVHKLKAFFYSFCASVTMQFICMVMLTAFLAFVLKVDFGPSLGFVLIICFFGSLAGVSFGAVLAALIKKGSRNMRISIMITVSLALSFLAGLNNISIKYAVTNAVPALAYVNPANLIADAFYALYYYSTYNRFFLNIGLLFGISMIFLLVIYLATRRQKYASL